MHRDRGYQRIRETEPPRPGRVAAAFALGVLASAVARAEDALEKGNEAFRAGDYAEAVELYEDMRDTDDLLVRRFNAGVSLLRAGDLAKASERFEDVSARAEPPLRNDALYNAGYVHFQRGRALLGEAAKLDAREEKLKQLGEAAQAYRSAADLYRRIDPPSEEADQNIAVAKTALRAVLDEIARIQEEARKEAEDEALKSPPDLLRALIAKERVHRSMARALATQKGSQIRLGARRLRQSTAASRQLAEKLHHHLTEEEAPPASQGAPPGASSPAEAAEAEKERRARAAESVAQAIEALKDAEVSYSRLEPATATSGHTRAIAALRKALEAFPIDLAAVIQEALQTQESIHDTLGKIVEAERAGLAETVQGSGIATDVVEALKDKVLMPLAKLISPQHVDELEALADEEEGVVWGSRILSVAEVPPTPPAQGGPAAGQAGPSLSEEEAQALSEALRQEGQTALDAATRAMGELREGQADPAYPDSEVALEALRRAADLLPKPPEPPEERLRKLIEREKGALEAVDGLPELAEDLRDTARAQIVTGQRSAGREAAGIAQELEQRQDEPARNAAGKVREGEGEVYASGEAVARDRNEEGKESIQRAIERFEEALALLSGQDPGQDQSQDDSRQDQNQDESRDQESEGDQSQYVLTPREARALQDELDRKRREEEARIYRGSSDITVEKDW